eukprot:g32006.t1
MEMFRNSQSCQIQILRIDVLQDRHGTWAHVGHDFPVGVGVLQPPTGVLHLQRDSSDEEEAEAQAEEEDGSFQGRIQTAKTRILEAPVEGDPDDLFARTGVAGPSRRSGLDLRWLNEDEQSDGLMGW